MPDGLGYEAIPKAIVYCLGQLSIGVVVVRGLGGNRSSDSPAANVLDSWLWRVATAVASLLVGALLARAWGHTAAAFGLSEASLTGNLRLIALESRWGHAWQLQMLMAIGLVAASVLIRVHKLGWVAFGLCGVGLALVMPQLGHASGSPWRVALHGAHNLASATWLGTLGVLTMVAFSRAASGEGTVSNLVRRFSPLALGSASVVLLSGTLAAWLYVGSFAALVTTLYGRILLMKLTCVGLVLACGWLNWRRARSGADPVRGVMAIEYACALMVVCLTGVLTETEHPYSAFLFQIPRSRWRQGW